MSADPRAAGARLERLLHLIPEAVREEGVRLSQMARTLEVAPEILQEDISILTERDAYLRAGEPGQLQVDLNLAEDRLRIWSPGPFTRPPRLSRRELLAVLLGLRSRALLRDEPPEPELEGLARRLEKQLGTPVQSDTERPALPLEDGSAGSVDARFRDQALTAIQECKQVRFSYLKPGQEEVEERVVEPYTLVYAEGEWYLLGRPVEVDEPRAFRIDRFLELEEAGDSGAFQIPEDFDATRLLPNRRVFFQGDAEPEPLRIPVRYSPRIARWIRERFQGQELEDGSLRVVHTVASREWLVRHVLQYAGEAVVEDPAGAKWVREALTGQEVHSQE